MTKCYEENIKLKKLVADKTDYNRITEMMKDTSGARHAAFIMFDEKNNE